MSIERFRQPGFTLIEIMLALSVSLVAMLAAVQLHSHASGMLRTAHVQHSLNETVRIALTAIRHDAELAGYTAFAAPEALAGASQQPAVEVRNDCGTRWATRLDEPVHGVDGSYRWRCPPYARAATPGADTLVLRYVEPQPATDLQPGQLYLESAAGRAPRLFGAPRGGAIDDADGVDETLRSINAVVVRGYYVSGMSAGSAAEEPVPSLRVKHLSRRGGAAAILDEEVQPGIEDLQIEYGIDADAPGEPGHGSVERYVAADALGAADRVRAVRLWLLARSTVRDPRLTEQSIPGYADRSAATWRDGYRRRLASMTIVIDDARPL